jgi:hypothetical protein
MPIAIPKPRHTVERSGNFVCVILPTRKNIFRIIFMVASLFMWGYLVSGFIYIGVAINKTIEMGKNSTPPVQPGNIFFYIFLCLSFFVLALLALGAFGLYRALWLFVGKEVIEATPQTFTITQQISRWKRAKEYSSEKVNDLRPNTQPLSTLFFPGKRVKKFMGGAGMIAFDYGARTFSFGQDIDEAEAKQIILALKEGLPQQKATQQSVLRNHK